MQKGMSWKQKAIIAAIPIATAAFLVYALYSKASKKIPSQTPTNTPYSTLSDIIKPLEHAYSALVLELEDHPKEKYVVISEHFANRGSTTKYYKVDEKRRANSGDGVLAASNASLSGEYGHPFMSATMQSLYPPYGIVKIGDPLFNLEKITDQGLIDAINQKQGFRARTGLGINHSLSGPIIDLPQIVTQYNTKSN